MGSMTHWATQLSPSQPEVQPEARLTQMDRLGFDLASQQMEQDGAVEGRGVTLPEPWPETPPGPPSGGSAAAPSMAAQVCGSGDKQESNTLDETLGCLSLAELRQVAEQHDTTGMILSDPIVSSSAQTMRIALHALLHDADEASDDYYNRSRMLSSRQSFVSPGALSARAYATPSPRRGAARGRMPAPEIIVTI